MSGPGTGEQRFRADNGSADPQVAAALAAFGSGRGSEHAALTALAGSRLLVPIVAALAGLAAGQPGSQITESQPSQMPTGPPARCGTSGSADRAGRGKTSDVAMPTLVGTDGRRAVPAFTSLDALNRWRPGARPVPTEARLVWQAAADDGSAVVVDIAGPVPIAVEGAPLAALARGEPVPMPHEDPDIREAVAAAAAQHAAVATVRLARGDADGELLIELTLAPGCDSAGAADLVTDLGAAMMARLGGRLRQGIAFAVSPAAERPA